MTTPMSLEAPGEAKASWLADARESIEALARRARTYDTTFTADDLRRLVGEPAHPNWVGGAFSSARRLGIITPAGYTTSSTRSRHRGVIRKWKAAGK
ncbi:hypothetical protein [Nesterenkonia sphaerica]|uniref:Uncharacterized protein n=1 Tax=Nesterenkonia sphaerica TaxID=1804988 RepID=A0A5R9A2W9_9MICC|nr:hypothetical protein [Nesterenkonia sphaerica]TLP72958.1 hypothetical protein FEF27_11050 [Nesterenkonia sphaerica]